MLMSLRQATACLCLVGICLTASAALAHEGPDPLFSWRLNGKAIKGQELRSRLGPDGKIVGEVRPLNDEFGGSIYFSGRKTKVAFSENVQETVASLPQQEMTISCWFSIDEPKDDGGIVGCFQDNGDLEKGWVLGYNRHSFTFGLATQGADDGDGDITYLKGKTGYEVGRMYHVVGTYDGKTMRLYVNGKLDAETNKQSGPIHYPEQETELVIAAYEDANEFNSHRGAIRSIEIYDLVAKEDWVEGEFQHAHQVAMLKPQGLSSGDLKFIVKPYLQFGTQTTMTVMWQTSHDCQTDLFWGPDASCENKISSDEVRGLHTFTIEGLEPETQYFYRTSSTMDDGSFLESEACTFVTAVHEQTPYAFAVIGDTQSNPDVASKIAALAWAQRPSFAVHAGDLVGTGPIDTHWTQEFFPSMNELIQRVPFYPVLGNHEQNAQNYFDYMTLPSPEYYYDFRYGNAHFFMIDSNRNVDHDSEQYQWLDKKLGDSTAKWKFVCHHHPPFSSDENDYGNLWETNKSSRGDLRIRQLVPLYEKHGVDIVWNGHIHSYERTWPLRDNRATDDKGTVYVVTGGGGGSLETPGPIRPYFQNNVRRGHHFVMVYVNGKQLEFKAFDIDGKLFDTFAIKKQD